MRPYNASRSNTLGWICYASFSDGSSDTSFHETEDEAKEHGNSALNDDEADLVVVAKVKREGGE